MKKEGKKYILGMRQRWMRTSIVAVSSVLLAIIIVFTVFVSNHYYTTVKSGLSSKAATATGFFENYVTSTYKEYYDSAVKYAETFEDSAKIELQFLDANGRIIKSTNTLTSGVKPATPDVSEAIETGNMSAFVGLSSSKDRIIAVTAPIFFDDGQIVGAMRYISGTDKADAKIINAVIIALIIAVCVLAIVIILNLLFIRSFIEPVSEITAMSKRIATGSYGIQIEKTYENEVGEMVESINEMSIKIAQADRMQTEFISSVSHELRTPLTAITGWSETLLYSDDLDEESRRGISIIQREARRLTKMVEELLEFTRMEDGRFTLNIEQIDICAELEDSIFAYSELLKQEDLEITYNAFDEDLPLIPGDPARLRQVFLNLFDNAAKYARNGKKIDVSVYHTGSYPGGYITITIRDFGPGLPEEELERVKMKFYKGSNAKGRGSGIGLAVCDEIIRYHGGELSLKNAEGGGLKVTVKLPTHTAI